MNDYASKEFELLENDEKLPANGCDVRWQINNRDCSGSQEMFSDDDQLRNSTFDSPKVTTKNDTFNSSISLRTPLFSSRLAQETPGKAVEPKTPVDLLPFITKASLLWTSDMETPQGKLNGKTESCNKTVNSVDINCTTPNRRKFTPNYEEMKANQAITTSPVLGGKKRSKRKVKRRILNNLALELDSNNDQQSSISSNSDRVPSEAASSVSNDLPTEIEENKKSVIKECSGLASKAFKENKKFKEVAAEANIETENKKSDIKECNGSTNKDFKENKSLAEAVTSDKNSNTSTQDFFCNASFSSIDRLCSVIQEEKPDLTDNEGDTKNNKNNSIKKENIIDDKENLLITNKSNNVLERVAAIRRNQKPLRRSTDISHTVIPKEIFSKSVVELELADAKFSQEKKKTPNNQHKPLKLSSFTKLSAIENKNSPNKKNAINYSTQDIPAEIMNDWNMDSIKCDASEKENLNILDINFYSAKSDEKLQESEKIQSKNNNLKLKNNLTLKSESSSKLIKLEKVNSDNNLNEMTDGFFKASGNNIAISKEIENENLNENTFIGLKQSNNMSKKIPHNIGRKSISKKQLTATVTHEENESPSSHDIKSANNKKSEIFKLYQELDLAEFLEPKLSPENASNEDVGFTTASGKGVKVSKKKENQYLKIYNELGDIDETGFLDLKKNKMSKLNTNQRAINKALIIYNKKETSSNNTISKDSKTSGLEIPFADVASDGFTTAGGKGLKVSEKKENQYFKIYNELGDVDEKGFLNLKKNKLSKLNTNHHTSNKALIVFNKKETSSSNIISKVSKTAESEIPFAEVAGDGFTTASGKGIKISEEREKQYLKIYNELGDIDESSLFDLKKNKILKLNTNKPTNAKALIVFNKKESSLNNQISTISVKSELDIPYAEIATNNNLPTASSTRINVKQEIESYSIKVFDTSTEDFQDENQILNISSNKLSKVNTGNKLSGKTDGQKKSENITAEAKLSTSNDTSEAFYNLGDFEELFALSNQNNELKNTKIDNNTCFIDPNSSLVFKKATQTSVESENAQNSLSTMVQMEQSVNIENSITSEKKIHVEIKNNLDSIKNFQENKNLEKENIHNGQDKRYMGILKRKLGNCEVKKPERSRSFSGFPISSEGVSLSKLNKSDPYDETSVNQPLQNLSVSQCFDPHSDSLLSKVELSYLNSSKVKSPVIKIQKTETKAYENLTVHNDYESENDEEFFGFSFKECTESFRLYARFKNFVNKRIKQRSVELSVEGGKTVSIFNETSSRQYIAVQYENNVDIKKCTNESSYTLTKCKPEAIAYKVPENYVSRVNKEQSNIKKGENVGKKRKHVDTDSGTPLTTLKKPRVGSELQGRKLFSDESDFEENNDELDLENQVEITKPAPLIETENIIQSEDEDLSEERFKAVLRQEEIIRNKKRMKIKPTIGSLLQQRLANSKNRVSWADLVGNAVPTARSIEQIKENHPDARVLEVTAANATFYKFLRSNIVENKKIVSLDVGDGAVLIFDENGHAGVSEFTQAFLAMSGVDPKLLPAGWIENHYKWIIWKLASVDRIHFNSTHIPKMLTVERVMKELKYRYDREIDRAQRPALRRILEKDDVPSRRMVLCISSIKENTNSDETEKDVRVMLGLSRYKIEATDGWYSIPLTIDNSMVNYVSNGKIKEGTKIVTYGAELLDCERGFYPLEKPANVSLKIYTNCTRRARWNTKLGYQKFSKPIPVKLRDIIMGGGMVGETTAVAARVYPLLYREKTPDGQSIYRNARSEEKVANAHQSALQIKLDAMYVMAEKNFDSKKKIHFDDELLENSQISSESQARRRKQDHWERKQEEFKQKLESEVRQGLPPPRNVTPVLKIRLFDDRTTVILTIWGANEDMNYDIKEGNTITVYNSFAMGSRGGELNLTANRMTHIKTEPLLKLPYPSRTCTLISDIASVNFEPKFSEIDTVGVVVSSGPAPYGMKNFEVVNMACLKPNNSGSSYLSILFWDGVASFGYQGMFAIGSFIACSNLEWRRNTSWSIAVAYCSEKTVFTCNPRQPHLIKEIRNLKALIHNPVTYAESCGEEVSIELSKKPQPRSNQGTPTSWSDRTSFYNSSMVSPMKNYSPGNPAIQKRLEKLSCFGTTSDISPVVLNNSSVRVRKDFIPVTTRNS